MFNMMFSQKYALFLRSPFSITQMADSPPVSVLCIYCYTIIIVIFFSVPSLFPICSAMDFQTCFSTCGGMGPAVRFPFSLAKSLTGTSCGLPGFGLRCKRADRFNSTDMMLIIKLPHSGEFLVRSINYSDQTITINDPGNCLPQRFLRSFNLSGSPFRPIMDLRYTFLNCTYAPAVPRDVPITCLSSRNYTLLATTLQDTDPSMKNMSHCRSISNLLLPFQGTSPSYPFAADLNKDVILTWDLPLCRECEESGGTCGVKMSGSDRLVGCLNLSSKSNGLSRAVKYSIVLVSGTSGLLCLIVLACITCRRIQTFSHQYRTGIDFPAPAGPHPTLLSQGLNGSTIESYPKIQLGESSCLPRPGDSTCSICLCEYQPKETLRAIPDCSHYFHVECVDEWLRLNPTCPLCRKSPEPSSLATSSPSLTVAS
ncbi:hypothetical protein SAY86_001049 [Trapa natans]|uniref:RING-type E3 ubiquitin transferase n=1 Tax=Trapa natans TaxID=22666 RepID=A0AAN7RM14_TRANT|nr:hypothetical protein SAY86_001049 [Trapa natans]